jgi:hypothetical protein
MQGSAQRETTPSTGAGRDRWICPGPRAEPGSHERDPSLSAEPESYERDRWTASSTSSGASCTAQTYECTNIGSALPQRYPCYIYSTMVSRMDSAAEDPYEQDTTSGPMDRKLPSFSKLSLNQHASFSKFVKVSQRRFTAEGKLNGSSLPDGTALGTDVEISLNALPQVPAEMWEGRILADNHDLLKRIGTLEWYEHLKTLPGATLGLLSPVEARILGPIIDRPPAPQTRAEGANLNADIADEGGGGGGGGRPTKTSKDKAPSSAATRPSPKAAEEEEGAQTGPGAEGGAGPAEETPKAVPPTPGTLAGLSTPRPRPSLQQAAADSAAARAVAAEARKATLRLNTLGDVATASPAPPGRAAPADPAPHAGDDSTVATAKGMADMNRLNEQLNHVTAQVTALQEDYPLLTAEWLGEGGEVAPLSRASPLLYGDVRRAVHRVRCFTHLMTCVAGTEVEAAAPQGRELARLMRPDEHDKALRDALRRSQGSLGPSDKVSRVFGIPPVVGLTMYVFRSYFAPTTASEAKTFVQVAQETKFVDPSSNLDYQGPSTALSGAFAACLRVGAEIPADKVVRAIIGHLAPVCRDPSTVRDETGAEIRFSLWATPLVTGMKPVGEHYEVHHLEAILDYLTSYTRCASREAALIYAATAPDPAFALEQWPAYDVHDEGLTVMSTDELRDACDGPGTPHRARLDKSLCLICAGAKPSWVCNLCSLLTPKGYPHCGRFYAEGCPGLESAGTTAGPEVLQRFSTNIREAQRQRAAAARGSASGGKGAPGGGKGGGRGGQGKGGGGRRGTAVAPDALVAYQPGGRRGTAVAPDALVACQPGAHDGDTYYPAPPQLHFPHAMAAGLPQQAGWSQQAAMAAQAQAWSANGQPYYVNAAGLHQGGSGLSGANGR